MRRTNYGVKWSLFNNPTQGRGCSRLVLTLPVPRLTGSGKRAVQDGRRDSGGFAIGSKVRRGNFKGPSGKEINNL